MPLKRLLGLDIARNPAKEIGCENLTKPNVKAEIDKAIAERSRRTGINQDRVLRELAKIAFVNPGDVINLNQATVKSDAKEEDLAAIASVKIKNHTNRRWRNNRKGNKTMRQTKSIRFTR